MCIRPSHCSFPKLLKIKGFSCRPKATCLTTPIDKNRPLSRNPNRGVGVGGTVGMRGVGTLLMHAHKASPEFQLSPRVATVRRRTTAPGCWHSFHPYRHNAPPVPTALSRLPLLPPRRAYRAYRSSHHTVPTAPSTTPPLPCLPFLPHLPFSCMKHVVITKQTTVSIHIDTINTKIYTPTVLP